MMVEVPNGNVEIHEALPSSAGPWPAVVVVHEAWGLNDDIRRIADRFASNGYLAFAPDLVEGGRIRCIARAFRDLQAEGGKTFEDLRAVIDTVTTDARVADGRVGVIGFCMGGGFALLAGTMAGVKAVSTNYGRVPADEKIELMCPVVGSYGEKDRSLAKQAIRLDQRLEEEGITHDVKIYPDAGHSFMNAHDSLLMRVLGRVMTVGYQAEAAEDAWQRILTFFSTNI